MAVQATPMPVASPSVVDEIFQIRSRSLAFRTVFLKDLFGKAATFEGTAFQDSSELGDWLGLHAASDKNVAALKNLDFASETGILVSFGQQPTLLRCEVIGVEDVGESLLVHSVRWTLPPGNGLAQVGNPAHYVTLRKLSLPVSFARPIDCPESARPVEIAWPAETYD